jgi:uncharacterized protein YbaA (DUF1428 family)
MTTMRYVDMFVCAVPTRSQVLHIDYVTVTTALLKEQGAQQVMECWGDDVPEGKLTFSAGF